MSSTAVTRPLTDSEVTTTLQQFADSHPLRINPDKEELTVNIKDGQVTFSTPSGRPVMLMSVQDFQDIQDWNHE